MVKTIYKLKTFTTIFLFFCFFAGCATKKHEPNIDIKQEIINSELLISKVAKLKKPTRYNLDIQKISKLYGHKAKLRAIDLNNLINSLYEANEYDKITEINDYFNLFEFTSDINVWGKSDYWASRIEFIGKGAGDCEDYAISKYFTLNQLGVPVDKLYFTYVKSLSLNQAHMVLSYYKTPDSIPLVLDNINGKILPATQRDDLVPIYSFNSNALFISRQTGLGKLVPSGAENNKKWKNLIHKIKKEGL